MAKLTRILITTALAILAVDAAAPPKAFSLDFTKEVKRDAPRLARRQKNVQVDVANGQILYLINVTIGTPPQQFSLQLDTGSSDIWVPATDADICVQTPDACGFGALDESASRTFELVGSDAFDISYADRSAVHGDYFNDTFTLGQTTLRSMKMGLARSASRGLGIMGIGFRAGESIAAQGANYANINDQLRTQGHINTLAYSLWLNDLDSDTGSILFGGVDTEKYHGDLTVIPVQPDADSGSITSFTVVLAAVGMTNKAGKNLNSQPSLAVPVILDSGTTDSYLPDNMVQPILSGVGAVNTRELGFIVPCDLADTGATFAFTFGAANGPTINVDISEFVTPIFTEDDRTPTFNDGTEACSWALLPAGGSPNLFGDSFLRSAYVVYDLQSEQIGLAQTNFNATNAHVVDFTNRDIPGASTTVTGIAVTQTFSGHPLATADITPAVGATKVGSGHPTPTYDLGTTVGKKKSASVELRAPAREAVSVVAGIVLVVSVVFGSSLVVFM